MSTVVPAPAAVLALDGDEVDALTELLRHSRHHKLTRGPRALREQLDAHREPDWVRDRSSFAAATSAFHPPLAEAHPADDHREPVDVAPPTLEVAGCLVAVTVEEAERGVPTLVLSVSFDEAELWITTPDGEQVPVELRLSGGTAWSSQRANGGERR